MNPYAPLNSSVSSRGIYVSSNGDPLATTLMPSTWFLILYTPSKSKMLLFTFSSTSFSPLTSNQSIYLDGTPFNGGQSSEGMSFEAFAESYFHSEPKSLMYLWVDISTSYMVSVVQEFKRIAKKLDFEYTFYDTTRNGIYGSSQGTEIELTSKRADQSGALTIDGKDFTCKPLNN